jgi:hypothetical protein
MSTETLTAAGGILISLACSYVPKLKDKYAALDGTQKRLVMLVALLAITAGTFGLSCAEVAISGVTLVTCDQAGAVSLVQPFIAALVANQAAFLISPNRGLLPPFTK